MLKEKRYTIAPFARKYWHIAKGFSFYGEASLPISFGNNKTEFESTQGFDLSEYNTKDDMYSLGIGLAPGFEYRVNSWFSVDAKLTLFNLTYSKLKPEEGDNRTNFSVNGDTNQGKIGDVALGVKFFF